MELLTYTHQGIYAVLAKVGHEVSPKGGVRMSFEEFKRQAIYSGAAPAITIRRSGTIGLNPAAVEALGDPKAVRYLFDRERRILGLRAVPADDPEGFAVQRQPESGSCSVNARTFLEHYEVERPVARRFLAKDYGDGILGIELDGPSEEIAPRNRPRERS
ncbi:MAG: hypothetical protein ACRDVM_01415 [Acidimicrobiia bacterium]